MDCKELPSLTTQQIIERFGKGNAPLYEALRLVCRDSATNDPVFTTLSGEENFCELFRETKIPLQFWEERYKGAEKMLKQELKSFMQEIDRAFLYSMRGVSYEHGRPKRRMCGIAQWLIGNSIPDSRVFQLNSASVVRQFDELVKENFSSLDGKLVLCGKKIIESFQLGEYPTSSFVFNGACGIWDYFILDPLKLGYRYVSNKEQEMGECPYIEMDIRIYEHTKGVVQGQVVYLNYNQYEILAELGLDYESPESHLWVRGN